MQPLDYVDDTMPPPYNYKTVELEKMKLVAQQYVSKELAEYFGLPPKLDISDQSAWMFDHLVVRIIQEVYGRQLERIEVTYPADWWQAFKERWCPAWILKRWPIQEKQFVLEAKELYPKMAMLTDNAILHLHKWESH